MSLLSSLNTLSQADNNAKSIIENTNSLLNYINVWVLFIILICIICVTIYFVQSVPEKKNIMADIRQKVSQISSSSTEKEKNYLSSKFKNEEILDYYEKIKMLTRDQKIDHLRLYAKEAQLIIPSFPKYPSDFQFNKKDQEEEIIESFMKSLFPTETFENIKAPWLKGNSLNCYSSNLMIAVEYRDERNYIWPNFTKSTKEEFEKLQILNSEKDQICLNYNICLIKISYLVPKPEIPFAIYCKLLDAVPYLNIEIVEKREK